MSDHEATRVFEALADPTRRDILELLRGGERAAGEIASRFDMAGPSVSRHLALLEAFLDHLSRALHTFPVYVGIGARRIRPLWIGDLVAILRAALLDGRLERRTVAATGPTEIGFDAAVRRIAAVVGRRPLFLRMPMGFHRALAICSEAVMSVPLLSRAQVRMLSEEIVEPVLAPDRLPADLCPATPFDERSIQRGLPEPGGFGLRDLRLCAGRSG